MTTHHEHTARVRPVVPCAAWHGTFGGRCLNCGYDPAPDLYGPDGVPLDGPRTTAAGHAAQLASINLAPDDGAWDAVSILWDWYRNAAADEGERYSEAIREANYARIRGYYGLSIPLNDPRLSGRAHIPERRYGCPVLFGLS